MTADPVSIRKANLRAEQRRAKRSRKTEKAKWHECFWTRPLGHAWQHIRGGYGYDDFTCVGCGRARREWCDL